MDKGSTNNAALGKLLEYLAVAQPREPQQFGTWHIQKVTGGANNLVYRASNSIIDVAVKFCVRDERNRAGREYGALLALREAGLILAPRPLLLEQRHYSQPVVVQEWLNGEVKSAPPGTDKGWMLLVQHYLSIHTLTPGMTTRQLPNALLNAVSVEAGKYLVANQLQLLPLEVYPKGLRKLIERFTAWKVPVWPTPRISLCRVDANITNFVQYTDYWRSLDWENSGWGDPAFEIADLMSHPAYLGVSATRWAWVINMYARLAGDAGVAERIQAYYVVMLVFWVVRLARYLYEIPKNLDVRLVEWPADWQADFQRKYQYYLDLANCQL